VTIRKKVIFSSAAILLGVLVFSGSVLVVASDLGEVALNLYDKAFIAVHYSHKVQTAFVRLEGRHVETDLPLHADEDKDALTAILADLDVARDRSTTPKQRLAIGVVQKELEALQSPDAAASGVTLQSVDKHLKRLTQRFADDALERRNSAEELIGRLKVILGVMAALAVAGVVGLAVFLIRSIVLPLKAVSSLIALAEADDFVVPPVLTDRRDEIGEMVKAIIAQREGARALLKAQNAQKAVEIEAERQRLEAAAAQERSNAQQQQVVAALTAALADISMGDLSRPIEDPFADHYDALRRDLNAAVGKLSGTLGHVSTASSAIYGHGSEIRQASDELSRRTEQQAASLEETTAALEEIKTAARRMASVAHEASAAVKVAKANADASGGIVRSAVNAMSAIEISCNKVGQIIGVIDEIAFQTNLLALNAGVEAARAGDSGRGFAVVATEVRALAQRSASAAKEIKALVLESNQQVNAGVGLVGESGEALLNIVSQVDRIEALVIEIAASAKAQSEGLVEVTEAVNLMDKATQQNAAMAEEAAAASHSFIAEAETLSGLVDQFKLVGRARKGSANAEATFPMGEAQRTDDFEGGTATLWVREANGRF